MQALTAKSGKAIVAEVPKPDPIEGDALIRVRLAGVCGTDIEILQGYSNFEGILGHEFVGVVEGGSPKLLGKRVVGEINCVCGRCDMCASGLSSHCRRRTVMGIVNRPGCFADYVAVPETNCHVVPDTVADEEAVFAEPLAAAYQVLRQLKLEKRMSVAVVGTGRLGLLVAQVLATSGCKLVAVGRNPKTIGLLDRRGIQATTAADLQGRAHEFDVAVDCAGTPDGLKLAMELVRPRGTIVMKTTCAGGHAVDLTPIVVNELMVIGSRCGPFGEALSALARKQVDVSSLVTRRLPLSEGPAALALAAQPDQIKVLLNIS